MHWVTMAVSRRLNKRTTGAHAALYRLTGGLLGGRFRKFGVLLLTTTGRKSGLKRTSPLNYVRYGNGYAVAASNSGHDSPSAWLLNIQSDPHATVQIGRRTITVLGRVATPEERDRIWSEFKRKGENYAEYERLTDRYIPVVILEPTKPESK
jgi:F420H(2)-dependent quinone reductase